MASELQSEIQKEGAKYVRHSLRSAPTQPLSGKDSAIPAAVHAHYAEIDRLCAEKEQLARRLVQLVSRAQSRLDRDLNRVLTLQGEPQLDSAAAGGTPAYYYYGASRNPVAQLNESLRSAIAVPETPATPTPVAQAGPPQKSACPSVFRRYCADSPYFSFVERRVTATASAGSIKLPSPAPATVPAPAPAGGSGRSRLSQQVHTAGSGRGRRAAASLGPDADEDAEGEDDVEDEAMDDGADAEDKELYCFCQRLSYGEMIGCDNAECPYQWVRFLQLLLSVWCAVCGTLTGSCSSISTASTSSRRCPRRGTVRSVRRSWGARRAQGPSAARAGRSNDRGHARTQHTHSALLPSPYDRYTCTSCANGSGYDYIVQPDVQYYAG